MQVMVDSNIILSALIFPKGKASEAFEKCITNYYVVICSYVIEECRRVVMKKFPKYINDFEIFIKSLIFKLVITPSDIQTDLFDIRDKNDYPILYTAIVENVDIFLTGDKDYYEVKIDRPIIVSPSNFLEKY